ncbi:hypothetical protein [uncultured Pseudokineococcus sp.]|uniref:hypothetical protein n=1 Tax=uncultured Pseudokineococcus sp. TaxID=1642928 RepID=UPI00261BA051|nr:hypothetical protein [uncultured Pseudokineococcus sp.]
MTTATAPRAGRATHGPGASALAVLRLQTTKRFETFGSPLVVLATALLVTALVALVVWRATPEGSGTWVEVSRGLQLVLWWLVGYMVYNGVQSVATTFPLALTLGSTRAAFTAGTAAHHVLVSAHVTLVALALLGLEHLTDRWFTGLHLLDSLFLGGGDPVRLVAILFLGQLVALSVGGAFAAVWVRHGPRVTFAAGVGVVLVLALAAALVVPEVVEAADAFRLWWLAVLAVGVIALCALVQTLALRRAAVR